MIKPIHKYLFLLLLAGFMFSTAPTHVAAQSPGDTSSHIGASSALEKILTQEEVSGKFLRQEAKILAELENNNTAAKRAMLAWLRHDYATARFEQYKTFKDETDLNSALSYAESATELSSNTVQFWKTFGLINLASKKGMIADIQAEGAFLRVLEITPDDGEARQMLINFLLKDREYKKAAEHYAILFIRQPELVIANDLHRMNLAFISADVAGWGIEIYDGYLKKYPDNGKVLVAKSILLKADGYDAQASRLLGETISSAKTTQQIKTTARNLLVYWRDEQ